MPRQKTWLTRLLSICAVFLLCLPATAGASPESEILFIFNHGSSVHYCADCHIPLLHPRLHWLNDIDMRYTEGLKVRVVSPRLHLSVRSPSATGGVVIRRGLAVPCPEQIRLTANGIDCAKGTDTYPLSGATILKCPEGMREICERNQHIRTHRSDDFREYIASKRLVVDFMEERLKDWRAPAPSSHGRTPRSLIDFPRECPPYRY